MFLDVLLSPADFLGPFLMYCFFNKKLKEMSCFVNNRTTVFSPRCQFANDQLTNFEVDSPTFA